MRVRVRERENRPGICSIRVDKLKLLPTDREKNRKKCNTHMPYLKKKKSNICCF